MTSRDIRVYSLTVLLLLLTALLVLSNADKIDSIPQPQIITPTEQEPSRGDFVRTISCEATAYTHTGNKTATGTWPKYGTIAADPSVFPFGTVLEIEGYGIGTVEDTGGLIVGHKIDLFMESKSDCLKWGRKQVEVKILREGYHDTTSDEDTTINPNGQGAEAGTQNHRIAP